VLVASSGATRRRDDHLRSGYHWWARVAADPGWLYSDQTRLSIATAAFQAALLRDCASTLTALLDAAPGFLIHGDADQGRNFKVAVCGDNPDAVEYLLRSDFDPWSGDDAYEHSDAWHMIGDNGAGRVLARLLDIMADTSSAVLDVRSVDKNRGLLRWPLAVGTRRTARPARLRDNEEWRYGMRGLPLRTVAS
jgi:hypothetical protein